MATHPRTHFPRLIEHLESLVRPQTASSPSAAEYYTPPASALDGYNDLHHRLPPPLSAPAPVATEAAADVLLALSNQSPSSVSAAGSSTSSAPGHLRPITDTSAAPPPIDEVRRVQGIYRDMAVLHPAWPQHLPPPDLLSSLAETFFDCLPHAQRLLNKPYFMASLSYLPDHPRFPLLGECSFLASQYRLFVEPG